MSDTGSNGDNKTQQDPTLGSPEPVTVPEVENKPVTPVKRTPSKRVSAAQRESEELVKTLGGSLDIEGGRKTRSSTRGTPSRTNVVDTPPPTKKSRASSGTPKRGRGRKIDTTVEDEVKTSPEKAPSEQEPIKEEDESVPMEEPKPEEKVEDKKVAEEKETPAAATVEEKQSPAKQEPIPEPMEVDGLSKDTPIESEPVDDSAQNEIKSSEKPLEEEPKESEKVVVAVEEVKSASTVESNDLPPVVADEDKKSTNDNDNVGNAHENNVEANDIKANANSLPAAEVPLPPTTPTKPVSVEGNEHKAESNDLSEPKIASPPMSAKNEGATPQYCN